MDKEKVIAWLADEELYYREHGDTHNSLMACYALELLKEQEDLGTELTNTVELIHKKNERIEKLLKEREAVKPMLITWNHPLKGIAYVCPNCKKEARDYWKYCPFCGKAIDWESR